METIHDFPSPSKTPERPTYAQQPHQTFTPCTRLSRMTITSDTNCFKHPVKSFQERLIEATEREAQAQSESSLGKKPQTIERKRRFSFFSEDEDDSDEGDAFSSDACILASPLENYVYPRFDDDFLLSSSDLQTEPFYEHGFEDMKYYDPSDKWLSQVYCDNSPVNADLPFFQTEDKDQNGENKPPVSTSGQELKRPWSFNNTERLPLQEIILEDKEDFPSKKRLLGSFKKLNSNLLRTVSPSVSIAKGKGKLEFEN